MPLKYLFDSRSPNVPLICLILGIVPITTSKQIATDSVQPQGGGDVVTAPAKGELR